MIAKCKLRPPLRKLPGETPKARARTPLPTGGRLDQQHVRQARDDRFCAGPQRRRFARDEARAALQPAAGGVVPSVYVQLTDGISAAAGH